MRTTDDWVARNVPDTQEAIRHALEILDRFGYKAHDAEHLIKHGQGGGPGDGDADLEMAISLLGRLREAGIEIK
ncbi:MAG: hypothetical protein M9925_05240 [Chloroflexi bacterium]|nr:hypothetical protein [Chloroflexota bacterium]MCZ7578798.1 hypothetical protein [Dehalococcoidia bacterium]